MEELEQLSLELADLTKKLSELYIEINGKLNRFNQLLAIKQAKWK